MRGAGAEKERRGGDVPWLPPAPWRGGEGGGGGAASSDARGDPERVAEPEEDVEAARAAPVFPR